MANQLGTALLPLGGSQPASAMQQPTLAPSGSPEVGAGSLYDALMPLYNTAQNFINPSDTIQNQYQPYEDARQNQRAAEAAKPYVPPVIDNSIYGK